MSPEAIVKAQARNILKQNYVKAIVAMLIVLLPFYMIDGATTAISCAIMNLISDEQVSTAVIYSIGYPVELIAGYLLSPVINGYVRAYYKAAYTNSIELRDVFYYFGAGRYGNALSLNIRVILRMLLPVLVLYLPLIIFETVSVNLDSDFYGSVLYNDFYFILAVLSTVTTTLYSTRYFTVFTVSADNPQFTPSQVFAYNKYIMKYRTGSAAKLIFSFTPWLLLGLLVLPLLYVIPYMTQSLCVSAKWMTKAALEEN
ncbi:MAG: DUF975 family protein [Ruminococcus sp.]|nr:DUF975 family protein [Ruminococcus sp.]